MKFSDLAALSRKDAEDNDGVDEIKKLYLSVVDEQMKSVESLKNTLENKFNSELRSILDLNSEIQYDEVDNEFFIKFGDGNISFEIKSATKKEDKYSVVKQVFMKRGDKSDFIYIELSPEFPTQYSFRILKTYVNQINEGNELSIQNIQEIKYEIKQIERSIAIISSSLPYIYYVYKNNKLGNGKANESENLTEMLDRAISWTTIFK